MRAGLLVVLLAGCAGDAGQAPRDTAAASCDSEDNTVAYVVRLLAFSDAQDGVSEGFNLDDHVSVAGEAGGCGKQDLVDPDGVEGIDNALAGLLPALEQTEGVAVESLVQEAVNTGALLIALEMTGVDDLQNDDCVTVRVGRAQGDPLIGNDGLLLDSQTLAWEPGTVGEPVQAAIVDGMLEASPLVVDIDLQIITADVQLSLLDSTLRASFEDDAPYATGIFGGGFRIAQLLDVLSDQGIADDLRTLLEQGLPLLADLTDPETGSCDMMSIVLDYEAVEVFLEE